MVLSHSRSSPPADIWHSFTPGPHASDRVHAGRYPSPAVWTSSELLFRRRQKSTKLNILVNPQSRQTPVLLWIKLLHTTIWLFFAGCIVAIPFAGAWRQFLWAAVLSGVVLFECLILAINRGRCPLTDLASRYTEERRDNFDIYLPLWLARRNKAIFGTLFVVSEVFVLGRWFISRP